MSMRVVAALAAWSVLCPCPARAEAAPGAPETSASGRYTIIRLPDDPDTRLPRLFIFDPGTGRMWALKAGGDKPFFQPVPYFSVEAPEHPTDAPIPSAR